MSQQALGAKDAGSFFGITKAVTRPALILVNRHNNAFLAQINTFFNFCVAHNAVSSLCHSNMSISL